MTTSIFIESRKWFDKSGGNSYFSNRIWVDGVPQIVTGLAYGHENACENAAIQSLIEHKILDAKFDGRPAWFVARETGIHIYTVQTDMRKRDMFKVTK